MDFLFPSLPVASRSLYTPPNISRPPPVCVRWNPPPPGFFALNCDASFRSLNDTGGYGVVVRNNLGKFILGKAKHIHRGDVVELKMSPGTAYGVIVLLIEMLAILDGLELAKELGLRRVEIQSDSKSAIEIVGGKARCPSECESILSGIILELRHFEVVDFRFIYREGNRAADFMSKTLSTNGEKWFTPADLPYQLQKIIEEDALGFLVVRM